jgi:hypothetical protein
MTTDSDPAEAPEGPSVGAAHVPTKKEKLKAFWVSKRCAVLLSLASGLLAGAFLGRLFPPFVLDNDFWRAFFTSAGFGGVMALAAAGVAFGAAAYSSHRAGQNALRDREQRDQAAEQDREQRDQAAEQDRQQREKADLRAQWWDRFTWATERALDPKTRDVGVVSMIGLVGHPWAGQEDTDIAFAVADALESMDTEDDDSIDTKGGVQ